MCVTRPTDGVSVCLVWVMAGDVGRREKRFSTSGGFSFVYYTNVFVTGCACPAPSDWGNRSKRGARHRARYIGRKMTFHILQQDVTALPSRSVVLRASHVRRFG